ncbi:putative signal peptidase complex subunit 2 [Zea mays]|uniref:Signal peptidase complex subunit 2 n=1 Tax=Zea mays TaxID=4577 RepID=A0A1D6I598_MAIZE|nr:putative signal peptidase complex subunit 2 [Zea mays]ONM55290.1 putative signal peptidase complex subunit 2 [Zea mays]
MFTLPPPSFANLWVFSQGSFSSNGLTISSKLPRFSDMYTLTIASVDPQSIAANKPIHFTKSVTKWYVPSDL